MKRFLKGAVQSAVSGVAPAVWRLRTQPRLLVLMYHRVLPVEHPQRLTEQPGMYVTPDTLAMHVHLLKEHFTLLHLDDWLDAVRHGRSLPVRACAITFDDGWRDNYQYAYPVLRKEEAPATIYLVSDLVGTSYTFWPNRFAGLLTARTSRELLPHLPDWLHKLVIDMGEPLNGEQIDALICRCKNVRTDAEMTAVLDDLEGSLPSSGSSERDLASWAEIEEMAGSGLIRIGSHTRRHVRLMATLAPDALEDEVVGSCRTLQERLGMAPRTFCYPNGDHSPAAVALVRRHYLGAVTTQDGWNAPGSDRHLLRRVGVHEDVSSNSTAFIARLAGVG